MNCTDCVWRPPAYGAMSCAGWVCWAEFRSATLPVIELGFRVCLALEGEPSSLSELARRRAA